MTAWVQCLRCAHVWDEGNPESEVCACLDTYGSRTVQELETLKLPLTNSAAQSDPPKFYADSTTRTARLSSADEMGAA